MTWKTLWISVAALFVIWLLGVSPVYVVMVTIAVGIVYYRYTLKRNRKNNG